MVLSQNRIPSVGIYVKEEFFENTDTPVWTAAYYLRYYLSRVAVSPFEIEKSGGEKGIYIDIAPDYADDEFSLKTENGSLYIKGGRRGVIYGVWDFLESLGCRFFTPECEKIPVIVNLEIPQIDKREKPVMEYRESDYTTLTDEKSLKFASQCRVNGSFHEFPEEFGGYIDYALGVHSFYALVPAFEHYPAHPEYYALYEGERVAGEGKEWQLCLSNPDIVPIAIDNARKILKENPDKKILSVSQNDNWHHCQCEECQRINEEEGSPIGAIIRLTNKIAEALEPEFPDVMFEILPYGYSRPANHKTRPRHNVNIRICASGTCMLHPYDACEDKRLAPPRPDGTKTLFIEDLTAWSDIADRLYVWDYTSNFPLYPMPFPNWRVLKPNLQIMRDNNVRGVFEEANRARGGGVDFNELRTYLLCKLMWNPDCDVDAHRKEFLDYYYGAAAPYLDEYLNVICDNADRLGCHIYYGTIDRYEYLNDECLEQYNKLFDKAEAAVAGDGIRLVRVQRARLSIRFCDVYWHEIIEKGFDTERINQLIVDLRAHGISRLDEWCNLEGTVYGWVRGWNRGVYVHIPFRYQGESLI
ncbi:MAG: DUF4838 domain-containing protein [Clostridia bacterium]|nr:DUF4838 domain-containing protein [Clostridia bacterium]